MALAPSFTISRNESYSETNFSKLGEDIGFTSDSLITSFSGFVIFRIIGSILSRVQLFGTPTSTSCPS